MILNRNAGIGLFEKNTHNEEGLFLFDFNTQKRIYLKAYSDWKPESVSPDGNKIAITNYPSTKTKYSKTDLIVMDLNSQNVLLDTHKYFVLDTAFDVTGNKLLVTAHKMKTFCLDIFKNEISAELPKELRLYKGDLDPEHNSFIMPCEKAKDTCYTFDFTTGKTGIQKLGIKERICRIRYSIDLAHLYAISEANILYCFDRNYKIKWSKNFNDTGRINSSDIYLTDNSMYIAVEAHDVKTNDWGTDFVIESNSGEIVNRIEGYQYRGRFATDYFKNRVLLHTFKTIDLITGHVSEEKII
ncbi:hypothetical protein [Elizabethkingia anophelis]|uniref:Uncharacterized protein n=1 Tax=Elizabethkingia anophelis TaxID=1117645 RepID=A0A7Z7PYZ5_9FLAO|nr:hypothetical protein [Elizabethkingia anophelis]MCT3630755.1 hypothetical protein [Elizabethkingia anophelis]MCT3634341.1 hypothetical protein [Elizabethkingia anophelis]MCT3815997.1 hypothetical protein [Elizabethkingia anophelis]MCT3831069.1 hypothetical protein [Elizabethkingia anophelis]MCT3873235.1 hypothetical protein [Elizabethkingia anophelis]